MPANDEGTGAPGVGEAVLFWTLGPLMVLAALGLLAVTAAWGSTFFLLKDVVERVQEVRQQIVDGTVTVDDPAAG